MIFFMQARNISCTIQFKDSDALTAKPLKCLYQRNGACTFTHQLTCPVLHHNTSPSFFEEVRYDVLCVNRDRPREKPLDVGYGESPICHRIQTNCRSGTILLWYFTASHIVIFLFQ